MLLVLFQKQGSVSVFDTNQAEKQRQISSFTSTTPSVASLMEQPCCICAPQDNTSTSLQQDEELKQQLSVARSHIAT